MRVKSLNCTGFSKKKQKTKPVKHWFFEILKKKLFTLVNSATVEPCSTVDVFPTETPSETCGAVWVLPTESTFILVINCLLTWLRVNLTRNHVTKQKKKNLLTFCL
jgi:hypothetical protein